MCGKLRSNSRWRKDRNVLSRGRYGRTRQITLELPEELSGKIQDTTLLNFELR